MGEWGDSWQDSWQRPSTSSRRKSVLPSGQETDDPDQNYPDPEADDDDGDGTIYTPPAGGTGGTGDTSGGGAGGQGGGGGSAYGGGASINIDNTYDTGWLGEQNEYDRALQRALQGNQLGYNRWRDEGQWGHEANLHGNQLDYERWRNRGQWGHEASEGGLQRDHEAGLQRGAQDWQSGESALDRQHETDFAAHRSNLARDAWQQRYDLLLNHLDDGEGDLYQTGKGPLLGDVSGIQMPGETDARAAEQAEFGRAAERVQDLTSGAERGLTESLARRGFTSAGAGGAEADLTEGIQEAGLGELSNLTREQAIQALERRQHAADRNLQADLTQRGQDVVQRGQDYGHLQQRMLARQNILGSLFGAGGIY